MIGIIVVSLIAIFAIIWIASVPWRKKQQRAKICAEPFPTAWRHIIKRRFPYFHSMPADLQLQLKKKIQIFVAEKEFIGCNGIVIDDDIRITVAAQACLLLLNRRTDFYPKLKQILIYPDIFWVENQRTDPAGVVSAQRNVLSGESWEYGKVVLSWRTTVSDAAAPHDGSNVVIHEFAHQLDQENGPANGAPPLRNITDYPSWSAILDKEYRTLCVQARTQQPSLFSYYGATNPAEFFAVVSEVFFEQPLKVNELHPALYQELSQFYQLDPVNWH